MGMIWGCGGWRSGTRADHIHIVATLARQDGRRPRIWNDYYRVREACHDAERRFGLRSTAPADRTAARRATRAETEQAARRGWARTGPGDAAPGGVHRGRRGGHGAGVLHSPAGGRSAGARAVQHGPTRSRSPGMRSGCRATRPRDGGVVWYGGGKLAADLTLPKLRARWAGPAAGARPVRRGGCSGGGGARRAADHGHPGGGTGRR